MGRLFLCCSIRNDPMKDEKGVSHRLRAILSFFFLFEYRPSLCALRRLTPHDLCAETDCQGLTEGLAGSLVSAPEIMTGKEDIKS